MKRFMVFVLILFFVFPIVVSAEEAHGPKGDVYAVNIDPSMPLEDMIKAGKYDWINDDIHTKNFPSQGEALGEVVIELLHFGWNVRYISTENVLTEMNRRGFCPATIRELAALGVAYPDLQREFVVVALGSRQTLDGDPYIAYLYGGGSGRWFSLLWIGHDWDGNYRFAVVRKPACGSAAFVPISVRGGGSLKSGRQAVL